MKIMQDEISIMTRFDHDHVIKHIESYEDERYVFMIMEALLDSVELNDVIKNKIRERDASGRDKYADPLFDESTVRWIMYALCSGCNHIHANGIVHRDLKPQNILIDDTTKMLKIIDFGLAKKTKGDHEAGLLIGTLDFIAPEIFQTRGDPRAYAPPCDMWALGIIMYQLFSGRNLFKRYENPETMRAIARDPVHFDYPLWK